MILRDPLISRSLLCLGLGLLTTVAIAWSSALLWPPRQREFVTQTLTPDDGSGGIYAARCAVGATMSCIAWFPSWPFYGEPVSMPLPADPELKVARTALVKFRKAGIFPRWWGRTPDIDAGQDNKQRRWYLQEARGWPVLALQSEATWVIPRTDTARIRGGVRLESNAQVFSFVSIPRTLPYRPIPLGLAADTLIFALAWLILLSTPCLVRRTLRHRRGLCPTCAYNLRGLPAGAPCPECGRSP